MSSAAKTYSGILNNRLVKYLNETNFFADEQNGFRKNRSCNDHIFTLNSLIKMSVQTQKPVYAAFVDLEKAFDRVNRDLLFYKLLRNNINVKYIRQLSFFIQIPYPVSL